MATAQAEQFETVVVGGGQAGIVSKANGRRTVRRVRPSRTLAEEVIKP